MAFSSREYRAINYVAHRNNWKLSLCSKPVVFYLDQAGKVIKHDISDVLAWYDSGRKEDNLARRRNQAAANGIQVSRTFSR